MTRTQALRMAKAGKVRKAAANLRMLRWLAPESPYPDSISFGRPLTKPEHAKAMRDIARKMVLPR